MTAYIFVLAVYDRETKEISFNHKVVMAQDADDAYLYGQRAAEEAGLIPVGPQQMANDYVIPLVAE